MKIFTEPIVQVKDLTRRYGYRVALRDVTFSLKPGGITALFGANGAGKTTLMRVLSTLLRPHKGTVHLFALDVEEYPLEIRERIGLIGDKPLLYSELTGRENLKFYGNLYGMDKNILEERILDLSERFEIKSWLDEPTKNLSTGLRKRFDIIRCVLHNPDLLLLDEPFSGLDKDSSEVFMQYVREVERDRTTLLTTHNLSLGEKMASNFLRLRKSRLDGMGAIADFDGQL